MKQGWQDAKAESEQVKDREHQSTQENMKETAKEWIFGDFSNRDARARNAKSKENIDLTNEQQKRETEKEAALKRLDDNYKKSPEHEKDHDMDKDK